ncbi:MAG: ActS/PrrB/RegB family redox-sensitive histidine kinase [Pseudomonadota bacterium]
MSERQDLSGAARPTIEGRARSPRFFFDLAPEGLKSVGSAFGRTRIRTLVTLRWIAVAGQAAAVLLVYYGLGFQLPLAGCLAAIAASAWLNIFLTAAFPAQRLASQLETAAQLAFDIAQVSALIALTGGLQNPFLLMILAPVTVAASRLSPLYAGALSLLGLICAAGMPLFALPLPWREDDALMLPDIYQWGQFAAVSIGLLFFAISAWRTGRDEARLVSALDAVQAVLAREQRLSALGALAAATAHELGTPLATIHLVARELARGVKPGDPLHEDVTLIAEQAERCRNILGQISQQGEADDIIHARMPITALIDEVSSPHNGRGVTIDLTSAPLSDAPDAERRPPVVWRSPEVLHALGAFVENAVSFAEKTVFVAARWSDDEIRLYVSDDGPGFSASVLPKLGEPYLSDRREDQAGGGMGLGFFIARTLLERTGARITPYNRSAPDHGAVIRISWPREAIEVRDWTDRRT